MVVAIYPGTFDPVTLGHVDVANRAAAIFEHVVVAVYASSSRGLLFTTEERVDLFRRAMENSPNLDVRPFEGLTVDFARQVGATVIVRGLRGGSDFEYEYEMAFMNKKLASDVELVCFMTSIEYQFIRSSLLKEVAGLSGDIGSLVPSHVATEVRRKMGLSEPHG